MKKRPPQTVPALSLLKATRATASPAVSPKHSTSACGRRFQRGKPLHQVGYTETSFLKWPYGLSFSLALDVTLFCFTKKTGAGVLDAHWEPQGQDKGVRWSLQAHRPASAGEQGAAQWISQRGEEGCSFAGWWEIGSNKIIMQYNTISKPHYSKKLIHFSWYLAIYFRGMGWGVLGV